MSVPDSPLQCATLGSEDDGAASMDSALNQGLISPGELEQVFTVLPRPLRRLVARVDGCLVIELDGRLTVARR